MLFFETFPIFLLTLFITDCELCEPFAIAINSHMRYILVILLLCFLESCCSSRVSSYTATSDTIFMKQHKLDSIYLHDSIFVNTYRDSDTIVKVITNHRNHYHYRTLVDTIYKVKTDTICISSPKIRDDHLSMSASSPLFFIISLIIIILIVYVSYIRFRSRTTR